MCRLLLAFVIILLSAVHVSAQNRVIAGKVSAEDGSPLARASLTVRGSRIAITTTPDGRFSFSVPFNTGTLIVAASGYIDQEIPITTATNTFDIKLRKLPELIMDTAEIFVSMRSLVFDTAEIVFEESELVPERSIILAYGSSRRQSLTSPVAQINDMDFMNRPLSNITAVIDGATPGVIASSLNGQPGTGLNMRIRGFGSFNATSEPLLVVDGVPYVGHSSNINPADVESITILKDAASSALYGSRAGNGVVMITTKKGRKGKSGISIRVLQGITDRAIPEYDRLNTLQYYPAMWEAYRNSLLYPISGTGISRDSANRVASGLTARTSILDQLAYNPFNVPENSIIGIDGQLNPAAQLLYGNDVDWSNELFRKGARSDYFLNVNGGTESADYLLSLGYVKENGFLLNSDLKRYTARLNVNAQPIDWLRIGLNISGNYSHSNLAQDSGSTALGNPFNFTRNIGPIYPVYAHDMTTGAYLLDTITGQRFWDLGNMGGMLGVPNRTSAAFAGRHALAETRLDQEFFRRSMMSARNYAEITFLRDFKFRNNISVDYQVQNNTSYDNNLVGDGAPNGISRKETLTNLGFVASQLLNYTKTLDVHNFDVLAGHESFSQHITSVIGIKQGQTVGGNVDLGNFSTVNSSGSFTDRYRIESFFGRVNYDFDGKYLASASVRRDGNSRFAPASRHGSFWSIGAGWNLSKEELLANVGWINLLKIRGSYGVTGVSDGDGSTNSFGYYAYQGLYNFFNNANEPGIAQSQTQALVSPGLTWEKNKQFDVGVDFSLFKNRISGSMDYFQRSSDDLIFAIPQPLSSGVLTVIENAGSMKNTGIELQLNGDIIRNKSINWSASLNLFKLKNEITEMPSAVPDFVNGTKRYSNGKSIFEYWLPSYYGIDSADGAVLYRAENTLTASNRRIIDNKDGKSDTLTLLSSNAKFDYHGSAIPDVYGSLSQSVSYKGLSLTALVTFQIGGKVYDANYQGLMSSGTYGGALSKDILDRWQKPGDLSAVPRLDAGRTTDFNAASSRWLIDASYLNIRAVSLAYAIPSSFLSRWNLVSAKLFVSAENLAFFSKRKGMDSRQDFSGVTFNGYSPARIISAGFTLQR